MPWSSTTTTTRQGSVDDQDEQDQNDDQDDDTTTTNKHHERVPDFLKKAGSLVSKFLQGRRRSSSSSTTVWIASDADDHPTRSPKPEEDEENDKDDDQEQQQDNNEEEEDDDSSTQSSVIIVPTLDGSSSRKSCSSSIGGGRRRSCGGGAGAGTGDRSSSSSGGSASDSGENNSSGSDWFTYNIGKTTSSSSRQSPSTTSSTTSYENNDGRNSNRKKKRRKIGEIEFQKQGSNEEGGVQSSSSSSTTSSRGGIPITNSKPFQPTCYALDRWSGRRCLALPTVNGRYCGIHSIALGGETRLPEAHDKFDQWYYGEESQTLRCLAISPTVSPQRRCQEMSIQGFDMCRRHLKYPPKRCYIIPSPTLPPVPAAPMEIDPSKRKRSKEQQPQTVVTPPEDSSVNDDDNDDAENLSFTRGDDTEEQEVINVGDSSNDDEISQDPENISFGDDTGEQVDDDVEVRGDTDGKEYCEDQSNIEDSKNLSNGTRKPQIITAQNETEQHLVVTPPSETEQQHIVTRREEKGDSDDSSLLGSDDDDDDDDDSDSDDEDDTDLSGDDDLSSEDSDTSYDSIYDEGSLMTSSDDEECRTRTTTKVANKKGLHSTVHTDKPNGTRVRPLTCQIIPADHDDPYSVDSSRPEPTHFDHTKDKLFSGKYSRQLQCYYEGCDGRRCPYRRKKNKGTDIYCYGHDVLTPQLLATITKSGVTLESSSDDDSTTGGISSDENDHEEVLPGSPTVPRTYTHVEFVKMWKNFEDVYTTTDDIESSKQIRSANQILSIEDTDGQAKAQYGRLLPLAMKRLIDEILGVTKDDVFLDIGHGIGNACMHAAFTVGCEARGIEVVYSRNFIATAFRDNLVDQHSRLGSSRIAGEVKLRHGRLEDELHRDFLTKGVTKAIVNNFNGVFAERSVKIKSFWFLDDYCAGLFGRMAPGACMVTLHPLSLGLSIDEANAARRKHKLPESPNASFFRVEKIVLGKACDTVKWNQKSGNEKLIYVYKYTRLEQESNEDESVFLCGNPVCILAQHSIPIPATTINDDGRCVINRCECGLAAKMLRQRTQVTYV